MGKLEFIAPLSPYAAPAQPQSRPVVAVQARNGCELRRAGVMVDDQGNIVEMRSAPVATLQSVAAAAAELAEDMRTVRNQVETLAANLGVTRKGGSRGQAEPAYLPPKPYFED